MKQLVYVLLLLLLMQGVVAWGVTPARYLADYTDETQEIIFTIRNSGFNEGYFEIDFGGSLARYAEYRGSDSIFFSPETDTQQVVVQINLEPEELTTPGKNSLRVIMRQIPEQGQATVTAKVTLVTEVVVNAPLEGAFIEANLYTQQSSPRADTPFQIALFNKGEGNVGVYADMRVLGPTNEVIEQWQTDTVIVQEQGTNKLRTAWEGEKEPGTYTVEAIVHYAEKVQKITKSFIVGSREVEILEVSSENFQLGQINRVELTARNTWNDVLEDVFAEIFVISSSGDVVQSFRTNPINFRAYQTQTLEAFWDTELLQVGEYTLNIVTEVGEESFQYSFPVRVQSDALSLATGEVTAEESEGSLNSIILIVLLVVVVTNVLVILYFRKNKSKQA